MEENKPASLVGEEASTSKPKIENVGPLELQSSNAPGNLTPTDSSNGSISSPDSKDVDMDLEEIPRKSPDIIVHKDEMIVPSHNSNGKMENTIDIHNLLEAAEQARRPREVLRTYNGIRKDNKDELGRCLDFLDTNIMNLRFRISDKEYVISSCNITITPVKKSTHPEEETVNIKKDDMSCVNPIVNKFMKDSVYSYREKVTKGSKSGKETVIPAPSPPDSIESYKNQSPNYSNGYLSHKREYKLREIGSDLMMKINHDNMHPTIKNMLTVPIVVGETSMSGYVFVSLTESCISMYYYSKEASLQKMLRETKSTFSYFTYAVLTSKHINLLLSYDAVADQMPSVNITEFVHKKTFGWSAHELVINETHDCECWCGKMVKFQPEVVSKPQPKLPVEELKETKPIMVMVDCDDCGKVYKQSAHHKCQRTKKTKPQEKTHSCEVCDRSFSRKAHLSNHLRSHKEYMKATVKCVLCVKRIPKGEFKKHKAECHPETANDFSCNECGKLLLSAYKLTKHMRDIHGIVDGKQEDNLTCEKCNMIYAASYYINEHQKECNPDSPQSFNSRTINSEVTLLNSSEESGPEKANYTGAEVLEDHNRTSSQSAENSKITNAADVSVKLFKAIRSAKDITDSDTYYTNVQVTEGYESDGDAYKILRPRTGKRFRYSEESTSESESDEPPRKKHRLFEVNDSSEDESCYLDQEELSDPTQDDAPNVLTGQAANSVREGEGNEVVFSECEDNTMQNRQEVDFNIDEYNYLLENIIPLGSNDGSEETEMDEDLLCDDPLSPEELDQIIERAAIRVTVNTVNNEVNHVSGENSLHSEARVPEVQNDMKSIDTERNNADIQCNTLGENVESINQDNTNAQYDTSGRDVGVVSIHEQKDNVDESNTNKEESHERNEICREVDLTNIVANNEGNKTMQVEESSSANCSYQQSTNATYVNLNNVTNTTSNENASVINSLFLEDL